MSKDFHAGGQEMPCTLSQLKSLTEYESLESRLEHSQKFVGVPQTPEPISAVSRPKFTILSGDVEEVLLLSKFFSDCRYMP